MFLINYDTITFSETGFIDCRSLKEKTHLTITIKKRAIKFKQALN